MTVHSSLDLPSSQTKEVSSLTMIASCAVIFLPVGIFAGAAYEIGLFQALGMQSPWRLFSLFPISPAELLRTTLGAGLFFAFLSSIAVFFALVAKLFAVHVVALADNEGSQLAPTYLERKLALWQAFILRLRSKSKVYCIAVDCTALLTVIATLVTVVVPATSLVLMFFFQNSFMLGAFVAIVVVIIQIRATIWAVFWYLGITANIGGFDVDSKRLVYATTAVLIVFILLFEQGRQEAIQLLKSSADSVDVATLQNSDQKCDLGLALPLVRSYTSGAIVLIGQKLVWIPFDSEKGSCISVIVNRPTVVSKLITPTLFGIRIDAFKFDYESLKFGGK